MTPAFMLASAPVHKPSVAGFAYNDMTALLLMCVLAFVLITGGFCLALVLLSRRARQQPRKSPPPEPPGLFKASGVVTPVFERPRRWLAIRSRNRPLVQEALGVQKPVPCSLEEGLDRARELRIFMAPPRNGWILVFGSDLPEACDDVDACFRFLLDLSRKIGHIQYFSADPVVNHHSWAMVEQGRVIRGYAWAGETLWNQGHLTRAERALRMTCFQYAESSPGYVWFGQDRPNAEKIAKLAARWGFPLTTLQEMLLHDEFGTAGELLHTKPHP